MHATLHDHPSHEMLTAYGAGKLDDGQTAEVEGHLQECDTCALFVSKLPDNSIIEVLRDAKAESDKDTALTAADVQRATKVPAALQATLPPAGITDIDAGRQDRGGEIPAELADHPRYEILQRLGEGGMGRVFKARHRIMNRVVAVKLVSQKLVSNPQAIERFRREVHAAASLAHPNIVTAHDAEQAGDVHFLAMEFVDGQDLEQLVQESGALPVATACEYIRQAAEGLQHAHEAAMVHRDIKPHNLMVGADGKVKILDFGLASLTAEILEEDLVDVNDVADADVSPRSPRLTISGTMMGTPDYISPEQGQDATSADIRSDIYGLGCTFYYLLAGKPPFDEGSVFDKLRAHTSEQAKPLEELRDDVPEEVAKIVRKMMAKRPEDRYQTPAEVAEALVAASCQLASSDAVETKPQGPQAGSLSPRGPRWLIPTAALLLLALLPLAWLYGAVVVRYATNKGVLVVEVDDENVEVVVKDNLGITLHDKSTDRQFTLTPTDGQIEVYDADSNLRLMTKDFTLTRGDKIYVRVTPVELAQQRARSNTGGLAGSGEFTPLFNGKDLTGWKVTTDYPNRWIVKDGLLTTTGATSARLFSERGDYENFHLRAEIRLGETGNSGVCFRSEFGYGFELTRIGGGANSRAPLGLEADLVAVPGPTSAGFGPAGTVYRLGETANDSRKATSDEVDPDTWFTFELIADLRQITTLIDGKVVNRFEDDGSYTAGGHLALASTRGRVEFRKIEIRELDARENLQQLATFEGHTDLIDGLAWSPDGRFVVTGGADGTVRRWQADASEETWKAEGLGGISSLAVSPDGKLVAAGTHGDHQVVLLNSESGNIARRMGQQSKTHSLAFTHDGKYLLSGDYRGATTLWNVATGEVDRALTAKGPPIETVAVSRDGRIAMAADYENTIRLWNTSDWNLLREIPDAHRDAALSSGGRLLACGRGKMFDTETGKLLKTLDMPDVANIHFTPDDRHVVICQWSRLLRVIDVATGKEVAQAESATQAICEAAISPDGRQVITGGGWMWDGQKIVRSGDNRVRLWQLPESVWPQAEVAGLDEQRVKELVAEAAGMSNEDNAEIAGASELPNPNSLQSKSLSLMLFSLLAIDLDDLARAKPGAEQDFRWLTEGRPKPAQVGMAISKSRNRGYASFIQPEYITNVTLQIDNLTAHGTVSFTAPDLYEGNVQYVARKKEGRWSVEELHLANIGLSLRRLDNGQWDRMQVVDRSDEAGPGEFNPLAAAEFQKRLRQTLSNAAGIPNDQWEKLATSPSPSADLIEGDPLSIVLFSLNPYKAAEDNPEVLKDFRYLVPRIPKPGDISKAMSVSNAHGYVSMIQPEYIKTTSQDVVDGKLVGSVQFEAPELYAGEVGYVMEFQGRRMNVVEFSLPNYGITIERKDDGTWIRRPASENSEDTESSRTLP